MSGPSAVVVGAGLAGLSAAWELRRWGFSVSVLERGPEAGGRVVSERVEGYELEAAWPVLGGGDRALLAWIDALGLRDTLGPLRPLIVSRPHRGTLREVDLRRLRGVARIPGVRLHEALRLARLPRLLARYRPHLDADAPERAAPLDDRSLADFGRLYFGPRIVDAWMAPCAAAASLGDPREESRAHFLRRLARSGGARPGLPRAGLAEIPRAAARSLPVHTAARVTRADAPLGGRPSLAVSEGTRDRVVEADAVVIATPAPEAAEIAAAALVRAEREALAAVGYAPSLVLALALRRPFAPHPVSVEFPWAPEAPFVSALLEPGAAGGRAPAGRGLAVLRASAALARRCRGVPDEVVTKELLDAFAELFPGAQAAVAHSRLFRTERAVPRFDVGRYRALARFERVQADLRARGRRLYFAGDYLMDPSLDGAVASGARAARAVAADLSARP